MNLMDESPDYTVEFLNNRLIDVFEKKYGRFDVITPKIDILFKMKSLTNFYSYRYLKLTDLSLHVLS